MSKRYFGTLLVILGFVFAHPAVLVRAQDPGEGSIVRDLTGGAALIFRAPANPAVHDTSSGSRGNVGGGKVGGHRTPRTAAGQQDQMIARGNAARSAANPRYAEAEQQYQLAARLDPEDARAFVGLGNVYVDQGRFAEA